MAEELWYRSYRDGAPPRCRRASRLPPMLQREIPIHLAISIARGTASCRRVFVGRTRERYWYWPDGDVVIPDERRGRNAEPTGWWLIPLRIATRARALVEAAERAYTHSPHAHAPSAEFRDHLVRQLERWKRNGRWRRIALRVSPRTAPPPRKLRWRKRKDARPARRPRPLPAMQGAQLRALRQRFDLTLADVATILGVSKSTAGALELGQTHLPVGTAVRWLERAAEMAAEGVTEAELMRLSQVARTEILAQSRKGA